MNIKLNIRVVNNKLNKITIVNEQKILSFKKTSQSNPVVEMAHVLRVR